MELHPSQRRVSCEFCRKSKAKCQRLRPDDLKCIRCTLNNVCCDVGEQRKVGRPKRKDPASSLSSEGQDTNVAKRQRKSSKPASQSKDVITPTPNHDVSVQDPPGHLDRDEGRIQEYMQESEVSRCYPRIQSSVPTSDYAQPETGWLGWPSVMTDRWCSKMLPSARILTESESSSPPDTPPKYPTQLFMGESWNEDQNGLLLPNLMEQAILQGSLAWINPDLWITPGPIPNYGKVKKKETRTLPFGIGKQHAYYVHENMFSSDPRDAAPGIRRADPSSAMVRMLSIVYGLRIRSTLVQNNNARMNLSILIHRRGPLFIDTYSLSEYVMTSAQELEQLVAILLSKLDTDCRPDEQFSACLLSTVVDVYCRILSFFELFLEHLTDGAERYASDPVVPIPGLMFNGVVLTGPCMQGVLFSSSIHQILGRLEDLLGLGPLSGYGLLSSDQLEELCTKLDQTNDLAQSRGIMRPADMKKLYAQVATVLEQLAVNEM
ncbi:hypothetical protein Q7P35_008787 [Cladosporium inversicolor]